MIVGKLILKVQKSSTFVDEGKSLPPFLTTFLRPLIFFHCSLGFGTFLAFFSPYFTLPPTVSFNLYIPPSHPLRYLYSFHFFLLLLRFYGVGGVSFFHFGCFLSHILNPPIIYWLITPSFTNKLWLCLHLIFRSCEVVPWHKNLPLQGCGVQAAASYSQV